MLIFVIVQEVCSTGQVPQIQKQQPRLLPGWWTETTCLFKQNIENKHKTTAYKGMIESRYF